MSKKINFQNTTKITEQYNPVDNKVETTTSPATDASESGVGIDIDLGIGFDAVQGTSPGTEGGDFIIDTGAGGAAADGPLTGQDAGTGGDFFVTAGAGGAAAGTDTASNVAGAGGLGGQTLIQGGPGGAGSDGSVDNGAPGIGGSNFLRAGKGGAGTPAQLGGAGGSIRIDAAAGGDDGGFGSGDTGGIFIGTSSTADIKTGFIRIGNNIDNPLVEIATDLTATAASSAGLTVLGGVGIGDNLIVSSTIKISDNGSVSGIPGQLVLPEIAVAASNPGAGSGSVYVDTGTGGRAELFYIDDTGASTQITDLGSVLGGTGDVSGPASSVDNSIVRFDSTTGKIIQGGAASDNVILDDNGNLYPETDGGGTLGVPLFQWQELNLANSGLIRFDTGDVSISHATNTLNFSSASNGYTFDSTVKPQLNDQAALGSTARQWSDLFLASGGVINFDNGDATVTHAANELIFAGATSGYTFNNGPVILDAQSSLISATTSIRPALYAHKPGNSQVVVVTAGFDANSNSQAVLGVSGVYKGILLSKEQLVSNNSAMRVQPAAMFWMIANPVDGDIFRLTDSVGNNDFFTFRNSPSIGFDVQIGASLSDTMDNLVATINSDSVIWGSTRYPDDLSKFGSLFTSAGCLVIYRDASVISSVTDRMWGTFATPSNAKYINFAEHPDYRLGFSTNYVEDLPGSDPGTKSGFGYGSTGSPSQGENTNGMIHSTLLDAALWMSCPMTPSFGTIGDNWQPLAGYNIRGNRSPLKIFTSEASGGSILQCRFENLTSVSAAVDWIQFQKSDGSGGFTEVGSINSEVVYGTFTGAHVSQVDEGVASGIDEIGFYDESSPPTKRYWTSGMIVAATGNVPAQGSIGSQPVNCTLADANDQKAVMGVFTEAFDLGHSKAYLDNSRPGFWYNAVGEGKILVCDISGNVDLGDYITSSVIAGYGRKQTDDIQHSYTVAKCVEQIDWASVTDYIDGHKWALVACTYHCG